MTQPANQPDPLDPNRPATPGQQQQQQPNADQPPPKKKKRRLWLKLLGGLVLLILLLVIFLPQIAGMGFVRSLVVSRVNDNLNGKLAIDDWHIGWTGGVVVQGVKLFDDKGTQILDVPRMSTQLSLIDAIKGKYNLGKTSIEGPAKFLLEVDKNGKTNFSRIAKTSPTEKANTHPEKTSKEPSKLPEVTGDFTIDATGEICQADKPPVYADQIKLGAKITDINAPISNEGTVVLRVGDSGKPGTIKLSGNLDAIDQNVVLEDLNKIAADEKVELSGIDLAAANPFLPPDTATIAGVTDGQLALKNGGATGTAANGQITIANVLASGKALKGDTFKSSIIKIPIDVGRTGEGAATQFSVNTLRVEMPDQEILLDVKGAIPQAALDNISAKKPPGAAGQIVATLTAANLKKLADQLPNTLGVQQGASVDSGKLTNIATLKIAPDAVTASNRLDVAELKTTTDGKQITAQPIVLTADANLLPPFTGVKTANVKLINGDAAKPLVSVAALANDIDNKSNVGAFQFDSSLVDLKQLQDQFRPFLAALAKQGIEIPSGEIYANAAGSYQGEAKTLKLDKPLAVSAHLSLAKRDPDVPNSPPRMVLNRENIRMTVGGTVAMSASGMHADLSQLALTSSSKLFNIAKAEGGNFVVEQKGGAISGNGTLSIGADLKRLSDVAQAFAPPTTQPASDVGQIKSGNLDATLALSGSADASDVKLDGKVANLSINTADPKNPINNETIALALHGTSGKGFESLTGDGAVNSSFVNTQIKKFDVAVSAPSIWEKLRQLQVEVDAPSLPKLQALANAFSPPSAAPAAPTARAEAQDWRGAIAQALMGQVRGDEPISSGRARRAADRSAPAKPQATDANAPPATQPLQITSGDAKLALNISRDVASNTTKLALTNLNVNNLAMQRGDQKWPEHASEKSSPITMNLVADLVTKPGTSPSPGSASSNAAPTTGPSAVELIDQLTITQLAADLPNVVALSMPQPIKVTNLSAAVPSANGSVAASGMLQNVTPVLAVLQGGEPLPYAGKFSLTQNLKSDAQGAAVAGNISVKPFQVLDAADKNKPVVNEPELAIRDDVAANLNSKTATINDLSVAMPQSKAVNLKLTGAVKQWDTQRQLDNMKMDVGYDLAKLWPIVHPMMVKPGEEDPYKDSKFAGTYQKTWNLGGSYPAGKPFNEAVQSLNVTGGLGVGLADHMGVKIENLELPLSLSGGRAGIGKATPAKCNDTGKFDLSGFVADLRDPAGMKLSAQKNHKLMQQVPLNKTMSQQLGKFANSLFANANDAAGFLDVTLVECQNVALGEKLKTPQSGRAKIVFSLTKMEINNPLGEEIVKQLPLDKIGLGHIGSATNAFRGEIKDGQVTLDKGVSTQSITFAVADPNARMEYGPDGKPKVPLYPLKIDGSTSLANLMQNLNVTLPSALLAKWVKSDDVQKFLPNGLTFPMRGPVTHPQLDLGGVGQQLVAGFAQNQAGRILGGGKDNKGGGQDIGNTIQDILGGGKKKDEPKQPNSTPPSDNQKKRSP